MKVLQEQEGGVFKINEGENEYARAYMGIDKETSVGGGEKVILVGTKKIPFSKGEDIYRDIINGSEEDGDNDEGSGVFDFSRPCPNYCDPESPLFG